MSRQWALEVLLKEALDLPDHTYELVNNAFHAAAGDVALDGVMPQEDISAHVLGCRGFARINKQLRVFADTDDQWHQAWRLVDQLIAAEEGVEVDTNATWEHVVRDVAASAVDVFYLWRRASYFESDRSFYATVTTSHQGDYARLLEWGLAHHEEIVSEARFVHEGERMRFLIEELGKVGNEKSVQILDAFRTDPLLADYVFDAIRSIRSAPT
jgi:hypothetical protein